MSQNGSSKTAEKFWALVMYILCAANAAGHVTGALLQLYTSANIHEFIGTCSNRILHQDQMIYMLGMVVDSSIQASCGFISGLT